MNVMQLKAMLNEFPDDMMVFIPSTISEYDFGLVNSVKSKDIRFYEDGNDEVDPAEVECVLLTED